MLEWPSLSIVNSTEPPENTCREKMVQFCKVVSVCVAAYSLLVRSVVMEFAWRTHTVRCMHG